MQNGNLRAAGACRCPVFAVLGLSGDAALGACSLEKLQQFPLDGLVARHNAALIEHPVFALCVAHECAGFAQDHDACCKVPGMEIALPEAIEPTGSGPGEVECRSAKPPYAGRGCHNGAKLLEEEIMCRLATMRDAGADHGRRQFRPSGD